MNLKNIQLQKLINFEGGNEGCSQNAIIFEPSKRIFCFKLSNRF